MAQLKNVDERVGKLEDKNHDILEKVNELNVATEKIKLIHYYLCSGFGFAGSIIGYVIQKFLFG